MSKNKPRKRRSSSDKVPKPVKLTPEMEEALAKIALKCDSERRFESVLADPKRFASTAQAAGVPKPLRDRIDGRIYDKVTRVVRKGRSVDQITKKKRKLPGRQMRELYAKAWEGQDRLAVSPEDEVPTSNVVRGTLKGDVLTRLLGGMQDTHPHRAIRTHVAAAGLPPVTAADLEIDDAFEHSLSITDNPEPPVARPMDFEGAGMTAEVRREKLRGAIREKHGFDPDNLSEEGLRMGSSPDMLALMSFGPGERLHRIIPTTFLFARPMMCECLSTRDRVMEVKDKEGYSAGYDQLIDNRGYTIGQIDHVAYPSLSDTFRELPIGERFGFTNILRRNPEFARSVIALGEYYKVEELRLTAQMLRGVDDETITRQRNDLNDFALAKLDNIVGDHVKEAMGTQPTSGYAIIRCGDVGGDNDIIAVRESKDADGDYYEALSYAPRQMILTTGHIPMLCHLATHNLLMHFDLVARLPAENAVGIQARGSTTKGQGPFLKDGGMLAPAVEDYDSVFAGRDGHWRTGHLRFVESMARTVSLEKLTLVSGSREVFDRFRGSSRSHHQGDARLDYTCEKLMEMWVKPINNVIGQDFYRGQETRPEELFHHLMAHASRETDPTDAELLDLKYKEGGWNVIKGIEHVLRAYLKLDETQSTEQVFRAGQDQGLLSAKGIENLTNASKLYGHIRNSMDLRMEGYVAGAVTVQDFNLRPNIMATVASDLSKFGDYGTVNPDILRRELMATGIEVEDELLHLTDKLDVEVGFTNRMTSRVLDIFEDEEFQQYTNSGDISMDLIREMRDQGLAGSQKDKFPRWKSTSMFMQFANGMADPLCIIQPDSLEEANMPLKASPPVRAAVVRQTLHNAYEVASQAGGDGLIERAPMAVADGSWVHIGDGSHEFDGKLMMFTNPESCGRLVDMLSPLILDGSIKYMKFANHPSIHGFEHSVACVYCKEGEHQELNHKISQIVGADSMYKPNSHTNEEAGLYLFFDHVNYGTEHNVPEYQREYMAYGVPSYTHLARLRSREFIEQSHLTEHQRVVLDGLLVKTLKREIMAKRFTGQEPLTEPERRVIQQTVTDQSEPDFPQMEVINQLAVRAGVHGLNPTVSAAMEYSLHHPVDEQRL